MRTALYILAVFAGCVVIAIATAFLPIPSAAKTSLSFLLSMPLGFLGMIYWMKGRE